MSHPTRRWLLLGAFLVLTGSLVWHLWEPLSTLLGDWERLRAWVLALGPWGPVALVLLGVIQVLVAPLPGYPIILVSGALYGGWWGAIYANLGIMLAGFCAAMLARSFGRPLAERFVAGTELRQMERLLESDSPWLWFLILLLPTGDLPYFAAGLSRLSMRDFLLALAAARLPFTFVLTHAAARAVTLPRSTLLLLLLPVGLVALLAYAQQERLGRATGSLIERAGRFAPDRARES